MSNWFILGIILLYLGFLFLIAFLAERNKQSKWVNSPYVYALSLAVYCSAWTYYGSVGVAARSGVEFLAIYLGPVIAAPLWIIVLRKIIQLSKLYNVSSIADFISLRYGNNPSIGALVTIICAISIIPYISLQLKAISETFQIITSAEANPVEGFVFSDTTFYIAITLAIFASFFGTLSLDASKRRKGIMFSIAFESVLKLTFFLIVGIYVIFFVFDGTQDVYNQANEKINLSSLSSVGGISGGLNWYFTIVLSFLVIFLLPRQFQVSVVEFSDRSQLKKAIWVFPLYLFLFNVFVIFIAWGGIVKLGTQDFNPDYFSLLIPLENGHNWLAVLVFLGGFSAVISMVVVSTLALSTMLSNNLIIPYGFLKKFTKNESVKNEKYIKVIRRASIFSLILLAYILYSFFDQNVSLFAIGLISFLIIAQLAPSFFLGMYWNRGSSLGAKVGMISGLLVCFYTYVLPFFATVVYNNPSIQMNGPWGIEALRPYQLLGLDVLNPTTHALFWSLLVNFFMYAAFSVSFKGNYRERNYGEMFVNSEQVVAMKETAFVWKGEAYVADIQQLLIRFIGSARAEKALLIFRRRYQVNPEEKLADARFINFAERLLTGAVGSASAKILIGSVAKEKPVSLVEVLQILEENRKTISSNKSLEAQSRKLVLLTNKLQQANEELQLQDQLKDDFLDTVAHELKTPVTSIQASGEVLSDGEDMPFALRKQFIENILNDTERLAILINDILDLEKLASGRAQLDLQKHDLVQTAKKAIQGVQYIADKRKISLQLETVSSSIMADYDHHKMMQVLTNLLSNSLKFVEEEVGEIKLNLNSNKKQVSYQVIDNGKGIPKEDLPHIFKKFYQSKHQNLKKQKGSGFGLAICKQIVELHGGSISAQANRTKGACIQVEFPKNTNS